MSHRHLFQGAVDSRLNEIDRVVRGAFICCALMINLTLAACTGESAYPSTANIADTGKLLSSDEQKKMVSDMQKETAQKTSAKDSTKN